MELSERMRNMALSWVTPYEQNGFDLIDEVAQLEAKNKRLSTDIGRVVIAIETGLTDKPSLEKIRDHLMKTLQDIGYVDALKEG